MKCYICGIEKPEIVVRVDSLRLDKNSRCIISTCKECIISAHEKLFIDKFSAGDFVICSGLNSHKKDVTGEIMLVNSIDIFHNLVYLTWFHHRRNCHMHIEQCKKISKDNLIFMLKTENSWHSISIDELYSRNKKRIKISERFSERLNEADCKYEQ